jgi:UPF0755 protein
MIRNDATWCISTLINLALFSISAISIIVVCIMLFYVYPVDRNSGPIQLKISRGLSSKAIAHQLARENLIRSPLVFQLATHLSGVSRSLKAGTYRLSRAMSLPEIINQLKTGKVVTHRFVVPEGLTAMQIGELWGRSAFGTATAFHQVASDPKWRVEYGISVETLEGYLFPNTYQFADGTPPGKVIEMMLDEFDRHWTYELSEEAESLGLTVHEVITLASIIEREAKAADERSAISAVFHNRLRRGWRLEADPTAVYALGNPKRPPTPADLKVDSPYNTYLHRGLPPGPICNPGGDSILAALRPASTTHLYFVAIGNGKHHFSTTLREHQNMIRKINRTVGQ